MWFAWQSGARVRELEQALVKRQQDSQTEAAEARLSARAAQELARETAAKAALTDARVSEITAQRTQVDQLLQSLSRTRDENVQADLESALQMAQQQSALTGSSEPLVAALRNADDRLARLGQPRFEPLRRAIARDLDTLRNANTVDVAALAERLSQAEALVDELPLRNARPVLAVAPGASAVQAEAAAPAAAKPGEPVSTSWGARLWQGLAPVWSELRSLVRVSRVDRPDAMLVAPEQAYFLRENLKLKLMNARLSLVGRQPDGARNDLKTARTAFELYFDPASRRGAQFNALLLRVDEQSGQVSVPRPEQSLAWLQTAAAPAR